MKNIRFYTLLVLIPATMFSVFGQPGRRGKFNVDEFHEKKWSFITTNASLSPAEMQAVKSIFMEYEKKNWELHQEIRKMFHQSRNRTLTEKEYRQLNDKMVNNEIKRSQYLREYHLKLRKLLKPQTLYKYYRAEKAFERQLLDKCPRGQVQQPK